MYYCTFLKFQTAVNREMDNIIQRLNNKEHALFKMLHAKAHKATDYHNIGGAMKEIQNLHEHHSETLFQRETVCTVTSDVSLPAESG